MKKQKLTVFIASGFVGCCLVILNQITITKFCDFLVNIKDPNVFDVHCMNFVSDMCMFLLIFIPIFIFSLITYFLKDTVTRAWLYFTYVAIPLTMYLVYLTPSFQSGGFIGITVTKGLTAFLLSILYAVISILIILFQVIRVYLLKKKGK